MKKKLGRKGMIVLAVISVILIFVITVCIVFIDNTNIDYERFDLGGDGEAVKLVHLSDLHFPKIKTGLDGMLEKITNEQADLIAVTGDLIDRSADVETCGVYGFIDKLSGIAPVYYVNGNHESENENAEKLYGYLKKKGVNVLSDESVNISIKNKRLTIIGLTDDASYDAKRYEKNPEIKHNFILMLAHHPEKWPEYSSDTHTIAPDLVLSGHAHGGQIRFFGQGLVAPDQGLLPTYDAGLYVSSDEKTKMIVSRGIGNSIFPFRFNNKPHIPVITFTI